MESWEYFHQTQSELGDSVQRRRHAQCPVFFLLLSFLRYYADGDEPTLQSGGKKRTFRPHEYLHLIVESIQMQNPARLGQYRVPSDCPLALALRVCGVTLEGKEGSCSRSRLQFESDTLNNQILYFSSRFPS